MKFVLVAIAALIVSVSTFVNGQSCTHGDIRLAGYYYRTNPDLEGRVEVCRNGYWGTICDSGWGNVDAGVVCRQLGHAYEGAIARPNAYYGRGYISIRMSSVGCSGTESRLVDCYYSTYISYYCDHYDDAGVKCLPGVSNTTVLERTIVEDNSDIEAVRLVNKAENTYDNLGRLEVQYNGTWGTVCDTFWSYSNAKVACRMLDFDDAACAVTTNDFGTASSAIPFLMSNVQCTGTEDTLDMCDFTGWGNIYSCSHSSNDAGVVCANTSQIGIPYNIRLVNSATTTLTINWTVPELPSSVPTLRYYISYQAETWTYPSYTTLNGNGNQEGDEVSLSLSYLTIDTEYTIQVRAEILYSPCTLYVSGNYSEPITFRTNATYKRSNIPIRLISPYPGVDFLGRIEVFYNNQWGTVCDDSFSTIDGNVVCRMLNFTKGALCTPGYASFGSGTGQIWLDNVACTSSDEVLEDCSHNGWGVHNCGHYSDVGVICRPTLPPVKNVRVTSVAHTSITVSWSEHSFPRGASGTLLEIRYESNGASYSTTVSSSATQYTLRSLGFEMEYNISIRARMWYSNCYYYYLYGEYSNEVVATTMETAPDGPPTLFTLEAINTTAIEAMWELPAINNRNGFIRGYKLFVMQGNTEIRNITIPNNETLVYIVGGLQRATAYTFSILAYTVADGPKSIHLTTDTLLHDPLIIGFGLYGNEDIDKVTRYTYNTGLQVHCTTSNDPSITSTDWYFANGTKVGLIDSNFREGYYPHNKTTVLQIGINRYLRLCDGGNYTCVVRTNTSRTEKRSFHLVIGTSAPSPSRPKAIKIKGNSVTIGWSQPACNGGHIPSSFRIRYKTTSSSSYSYNYYYITVSDSTQRNYTITGLRTTTSYDFSVQTTTVDSRTSSYSIAATIVTLPQPPSAPRNISVKLVKPLLVEVSWRAPATPNGVITHYTVYAKPLPSYEIDFRRKRQTTSLPRTIKKVFPGSLTSGNVTLTTQSITYRFQVSASTSHGQTANEGDPSSISANATIFVPEQGLPMPTNVITNSLTTNTSITLFWNYPPPPVETIESFFVTYSGSVEWRSPGGTLVMFEDTGELTVTGTSVKVSPLIPGTRYHFKVSAITPTGRGAEVSAFGTTQENEAKLAYFQLRMTPVYNCLELSNPNLNIIDSFRSAIAEEINSRVCPDCGLTTANIRNHEFSCRAGLTNHIVYRAMMVGTDLYSAPGLVSRIQSWVASGSASITALSTRLRLDKNCNASLDTLDEPDCLQVVETETTTANTIPVTKATTTSKPEVVTPSSKPIVAEQVRAGEVVGFVVGIVIIALLVVLIVVIIIIAVKRFKPKAIKSISHDRMFNASFSDIGSNRESVNLDDEHKGDILK